MVTFLFVAQEKVRGKQLPFTMHTIQLFSESKEMEHKSECKVNTSLPKYFEKMLKQNVTYLHDFVSANFVTNSVLFDSDKVPLL